MRRRIKGAPAITYIINYSPAVANGGIESGVATTWQQYTDGTGTVADTSEAHSGSLAARCNTFGGNALLISQDILTIGYTYNLSIWAKRTAAATSRLSIQLGSGNYFEPTLTTSWAEYVIEEVCSGDNYLRLSGDANAVVLIDDIRLYRVIP